MLRCLKLLSVRHALAFHYHNLKPLKQKFVSIPIHHLIIRKKHLTFLPIHTGNPNPFRLLPKIPGNQNPLPLPHSEISHNPWFLLQHRFCPSIHQGLLICWSFSQANKFFIKLKHTIWLFPLPLQVDFFIIGIYIQPWLSTGKSGILFPAPLERSSGIVPGIAADYSHSLLLW